MLLQILPYESLESFWTFLDIVVQIYLGVGLKELIQLWYSHLKLVWVPQFFYDVLYLLLSVAWVCRGLPTRTGPALALERLQNDINPFVYMVVSLRVALNDSVCLPNLFPFKLNKLVGNSLNNPNAHLIILGLVFMIDDNEVLVNSQ